MSITRREFVMISLAAALGGCSETARMASTRPDPIWPDIGSDNPMRSSNTVFTRPSRNTTPTSPARANDGSSLAGINVIPRSSWAKGPEIPSRLDRLDRVTRITVHHEGGAEAVWFTDVSQTKQRLDSIREAHQGRGWGDIGYHYVIDRAGRVWQGRKLTYVGAHVKDNNPQNIGVMVLGNFEIQKPSQAQINSLQQTLTALMRQYQVPINRIYTHTELGTTSCPGRNLQSVVNQLRRQRRIG